MGVQPLAREVLQRFESMKTLREGNWESKWQEIADFMLGRRDFLVSEDPGRRREIPIYDTTGRTMVNLLAGGLHSLLTNPSTEWLDLRTEDERLMEMHDVNLWLQFVKRRLLSVFQSPESRFTSQSDEVYLDLVSFGTGAMFVGDPIGEPVLFSARPLSEMYIAENERGEVDTAFRCFKMTSRNAVRTWGTGAPKAAIKNMEANRGEERVRVIHATFPSSDPHRPRGLGDTRFAYDSLFISKDDGTLLGRPNGYPERPYLITRWRVDGGEVYGRGPGDDALAEQKMASSMKQTTLQAGQMSVAPPFMTEDDGSIVQLDMRPFGRNIVRSGGTLNPPIQPLDIRSRADIGIDLIRDTRKQIEESFHFELLKLIQNRGLTPMTAKQASLIQNSVERLLAPILGRQQEDYLGPMIDRVYGIERLRGNIPDPPAALSGQPLKVEYVSPITRAQRRGDVDATLEWINTLMTLQQVQPGALDVVDLDEAARFLGVQGDVPASLMRSRADIRDLRKAQQELAAQQEQKDDLERMAKGLGAAAPALQLLQAGQ